MEKLINFLKKWASGKVLLGLLVVTMIVYLTMLLYSIPAVESFAPGKVLFDLSPTGYSYDTAISLLEALGPEGRAVYLRLQLPIDFIYPGLFAITYSLLLTLVFGKAYTPKSKMFYLAPIPFFGGLFDYLENISIIQMIKLYPNVSDELVRVSSSFTVLKSGITTIFFILLFAGLFQILRKRLTFGSSQR